MEDYAGASDERFADVDALLASAPKRSTAAVHIGGVAVECRIKSIVLRYHRILRWSEQGARPSDGFWRKPVPRPGHSLISAVRIMSKIYERAKADPLFLTHLDRLMHPIGSQDIDFIDMRYAATGVDSRALDEWEKSLEYVRGWLRKNEVLAA